MSFGLEVIVETDAEEVEVGSNSLGIHVGSEVESVGRGSCIAGVGGAAGAVVNVGSVPTVDKAKAEQVDIEVEGDVVVEFVVQTRGDGDAEAATIGVANISSVDSGLNGADFSSVIFEVGLAVDVDGQGGLTEEGEVAELRHIVAEVRGNLEAHVPLVLPVFSLVEGRGVGGTINSTVGASEVVGETQLGTNLHVVVELIANLRENGESAGGSSGDIPCGGRAADVGLISGSAAIGVEAKLATNHELCISCKCESSKREG